jgi:hypothetical protein
MIRPFTFVTLLLAAASGLYLYQTKHRAEVLDKTIERTLRQVAAARERTGMLRAEWALLNEPDRLNGLAAQHLVTLQPLPPSRFVTLADLGAHMPPPGAPAVAVAEEAPASQPVAAAPALAAATSTAPVRMVDAMPVETSVPAPRAASAVRAPQPRPVSRPAERPVERAVVAQRAAPAPVAEAAVAPIRRPVFAPVMSAVAGPMAAPMVSQVPAVTQIGLSTARSSVPAVTSALGGYGRPALAPPVPIRAN